MTIENPISMTFKSTTNHNRPEQRDETIRIHSNLSKRGKNRMVAISFCFHCLKEWRKIFKPITKRTFSNDHDNLYPDRQMDSHFAFTQSYQHNWWILEGYIPCGNDTDILHLYLHTTDCRGF